MGLYLRSFVYILDALTSKTELLLRCYSSSPESAGVTYDQLKVILAGQTAVVLDVREPWELREYGSIPGSINVPCESVLYCKGSQTFYAVTPKIIIFEVGTPLYLFDFIPQINIVKIADLKAHNASCREAL